MEVLTEIRMMDLETTLGVKIKINIKKNQYNYKKKKKIRTLMNTQDDQENP